MKETKGITLIALIVTIIILLILAGVTISALMGENGTLNQAVDAKFKNTLATIEEQINIYKYQKNVENVLGIDAYPIEKENGKAPSVLCVICGLSNAAYKRPDGVYVVPITALKP